LETATTSEAVLLSRDRYTPKSGRGLAVWRGKCTVIPSINLPRKGARRTPMENFNPGAGWQNGNNDTKEMHGRQIENRQFISLNTVFVHLSEHS